MPEPQRQTLIERFKAKEYLTKEEKCQLAKSFDITINKVENWFNKMRCKKVPEGMLNQSEYYSVCSFSVQYMYELIATFILCTLTHTCMQYMQAHIPLFDPFCLSIVNDGTNQKIDAT